MSQNESTQMDQDSPFVSVIVPVYNDPEGIEACIERLLDQTYPEDRYELIVVDNGSTDETRSVVREYPVDLRLEDEVQGSYAARNRGISAASGEVLAFTDADCEPLEDWIENGVRELHVSDADIAAGRVKFDFPDSPTAADRFDASVHMRNKQSVENGVAKTANVFVKSEVFDHVGLFPQDLISGGDVQWTKRATDSGFELVYASDAIVRHPSRSLLPLLKKEYRVGRGKVQSRYEADEPAGLLLLRALVRFPRKVLGGVTSDGVSVESEPDRRVERSVGFFIVAALMISVSSVGSVREVAVHNAMRVINILP